MERGVQLAALRAGGQHDPLDQRLNGHRRLVAVTGFGQCLGKPLDLAALEAGDVGVDVRYIDRSG